MSHSSVWQYDHTLSAHSSPLTEHSRAGSESHVHSADCGQQTAAPTFVLHPHPLHPQGKVFSRVGIPAWDTHDIGDGMRQVLALAWGRLCSQKGIAI